jgi:hypothetical protein
MGVLPFGPLQKDYKSVQLWATWLWNTVWCVATRNILGNKLKMLWELIESALGLERLSKLDGHILGTSKSIKSNPTPLISHSSPKSEIILSTK